MTGASLPAGVGIFPFDTKSRLVLESMSAGYFCRGKAGGA
jgi:hypothetical protein